MTFNWFKKKKQEKAKIDSETFFNYIIDGLSSIKNKYCKHYSFCDFYSCPESLNYYLINPSEFLKYIDNFKGGK